MKEFEFTFDQIFGGISPDRNPSKRVIGLSECHNLMPVSNDYILHELVIDLNDSDFNWNESAYTLPGDGTSIWEDNQSTNWDDEQNSVFENH